METLNCQLKKQGVAPGSCLVRVDGKNQPACQATLRYENGDIYRLITSPDLKTIFTYISLGAIFPAENVTPGISAKYRMAPGMHLGIS